MAMLAMEPSRPNHIGGLGQYNRTLKEMDLRGCTVDANQLHRLLSWRTAHACVSTISFARIALP